MLDIISDNADFLIAGANTALDASLVPTMINQQRDKASTIPLATSVTSTALWLFTALVFASISLWITMCAAIITASLWAIIAAQRLRYGDPATDNGKHSPNS
jgi:hypothetical protein